jgi:gamma-glutamyltranspeptidase/glutathione hydrolase
LRRARIRRRAAVLLAASLAMSGCSTLGSIKDTFLGGQSGSDGPKRLTGFIGAAVADEPRAALAAREVLALGGTAADAAVALGFTLAVTLPSRAGLGGGGACLAYSPSLSGPGQGNPEAIVFTPVAPSAPPPNTDRPAAAPMLARGLFALHARYGKQSFESLVTPAEQLARFGVPISRALLRDLAVVAGPLAADPNAAAVFAPGGTPLAEGGTLLQNDLGGTLAQLRTAGVGDLYQGGLARRLEDASRIAGGGLSLADLRAALPRTGAPLVIRAGRDSVAFLPPPADGGLGAAAAFQALQANPNDVVAAQARAISAVVQWRQGGGDPQAVLAAAQTGGSLPSLPASTGFAVLDRNGNSVACAVTMNNLFGTGRIAPGTGILLAASPRAVTSPLLSAAIAWNSNIRGFRAAVTGAGQEGAALAVAVGLTNTLRSGTAMPAPVPEPGRANVIACSRYLPDSDGSCGSAVDPRGFGLAAGSN